jgi:DNA-binding transcriptional MerR regulator
MYTISEFAKIVNVTTKTLREWDRIGKLIAIRLPSGHRRYSLMNIYIKLKALKISKG